MTTVVGSVTSVERRILGSSLTADAAIGATTLTVDFTADFDETGGVLLLNDETLAYTKVDSDAGTITLAVALAAAALAGDPVQAVEAGLPAVEWAANVTTGEGDTVPAVIPTTLIPYFVEGTYDEPVEVELEVRGSGYRVVSQPSRAAMFEVDSSSDFTITDADGNAVFSADDGPVRFWWQQGNTDSTTFPASSWDPYDTISIPVPPGYSTALVMMTASAGATFTGDGNVGVQPVIDGFPGPALSNGINGGGPVSVSSGMSYAVDLTGRTSFDIAALAIRNGAVTAGSNNVHHASTTFFLR